MTYEEAVAFLRTFDSDRLLAIAWKLDKIDGQPLGTLGYTEEIKARALAATAHAAQTEGTEGRPGKDLLKLAEALRILRGVLLGRP